MDRTAVQSKIVMGIAHRATVLPLIKKRLKTCTMGIDAPI